ncbi:MAG TPA: MBL fold metallo-hydrolase [Micromonospora sp.]|nr:MAG: MBL fold metallo-hydrolase [Actinomycetota bacterium]
MRQPDRIDDPDRRRWQEPGIYDVAPGIVRIPLPIPDEGLKTVNVYLVEGDDGLTLIDAGWAFQPARTALDDALAELSYSVRDIRTILVTHVHADHYSQGVTLRRDSGCTLALGEYERPSLEVMRAGRGSDGLLTSLRRHAAEPVIEALRAAGFGRESDDDDLWELPDEWVADGRLFEVGKARLRAMHTPGHTRGHVVYVDADQEVIFSGDHVLPHITPSIGLESSGAEHPLESYLSSLRAVRALPDMLMLPAHGPVRTSVHARIDELLAHHEARLDACAACLDARPRTAYEVARDLPWTRRAQRFDDLAPHHQMLAVVETAAHLDVVHRRGRCARVDVAGVVRYHV